MKRKKISGGSLIMVPIIVASGLLLSVLGQRQYVRATTDEVWVASGTLSPGQVVQSRDLIKTRLDEDDVIGAVTNPKAMIGKQLKVEKEEGDAFYSDDFMGAKKNWMSTMAPEGRVIYTLVPDKYLLPYTQQLREGDRFDILITQRGGRVSPLAFDVILMGTLKDNTHKAEQESRGMITALAAQKPQNKDESKDESRLLILAVNPNHVFPLASAQGSGGKLSFVVHGQKELQKGERLSVMPKTRPVEIYTGLQKSQVKVRS